MLSARAEPLAMLRMVVPFIAVLSPEPSDAARLATAPALALHPPAWLDVLAPVLPFSPTLVLCARGVFFASALFAILGMYTRFAMPIFAAALFYLFSIPQRTGTVLHDMHLVWFAMLLAVSPCADVWSVDARLDAASRAPSLRYGVPLVFVRLLLACVYFFPGLWKLREGGAAWLSGDVLVAQVHAKWFVHGSIPWRFDRVPGLARVLAYLAVGCEVGFPILALTRRGRPWALQLGLGFHAFARLVMFIPFPSLWITYVALLDGDRFMLLPRRVQPAAASERFPWLPGVVGVALVACVMMEGVRGRTQAWPFACYPKFSTMPAREIVDLEIDVLDRNGAHVRIDDMRGDRGARPEAIWARVWRLGGAYGDALDRRSLAAHVRDMAARTQQTSALAGAQRVTIARVLTATDPDDAAPEKSRQVYAVLDGSW